MSAEKPFEERLGAALGQASEEPVRNLLAEITRVEAEVSREVEVATETESDPLRSEAAAAKAQASRTAGQRRLARIEAARTLLEDKLYEIAAERKREASASAYREAIAARDAAAALLLERYPAVAKELSEIITAVARADQMVERANKAIPPGGMPIMKVQPHARRAIGVEIPPGRNRDIQDITRDVVVPSFTKPKSGRGWSGKGSRVAVDDVPAAAAG